MSEPRTESQMLARAPIELQLAGKRYEIPVRGINASRKWREKLIASAQEIASVLRSNTNGLDDSFFVGLGKMYLGFPEKMADLIFAYAGDELDRDQILEEGTDEELALAFTAIVNVAFPFERQVSTMTLILEMGEKLQSLSAKSTR